MSALLLLLLLLLTGEPRQHRAPQAPPGAGEDPPIESLGGSLRALATWMGAVSLLALCGLIWLLYP